MKQKSVRLVQNICKHTAITWATCCNQQKRQSQLSTCEDILITMVNYTTERFSMSSTFATITMLPVSGLKRLHSANKDTINQMEQMATKALAK